ncbi:membrane protein [Salinimicrobium marinum]|uniref:Membrane protein n=1 Tax=Salinimicrobium marinum TaxID=680283 RepID=A0A918SAM7_9FLAO|nr:BatA domain-containing protein [Salinimicrobium marinum]GHA31324.1 membrane protein [Salinimicrobium marinum]
MHFKYPELLYALFLLVIPLLVHLFQLRKFRKEKFTNVKFLRKASLQTRKSSQVKKWLILCTRLLLLAAIIFAFAQPFFPSDSNRAAVERETVIYLDNSYSMQARGSNGILLRRGVQELLEYLPVDATFSFFTNDAEFKNVTAENLRNDLQQLTYSPNQLSWEAVQIKAGNYFSDNPGASKNLITISDFQKKRDSEVLTSGKGIYTRIVQMEPENITNITIDTAFIAARTLDESTLTVGLKATGNPSAEIPVSLYNNDHLLAKKTVSLKEDLSAETTFKVTSENLPGGRISINDSGLNFDNQLFFSINKNDPVKVVVITNSDDSFLRRIFREPDFNLKSFSENRVDFNALTSANLIVLNEPEEISSPLAGTLRSLLQEDIYLALIPSEGADLTTYNAFFREVGLPAFEQKSDQEKLITMISYAHPLYQSVFDEEVHNFQYPKVQSSYSLTGNVIPVLSYENGEAFLFQKGNIFVFTGALNTENSNFQMAPLIVPTFFNIGNLALEASQLYYISGNSAKVDLNVSLGRDEILKVHSSDYSFIPRQQNFQRKVELYFDEAPEEAGHYSVVKDTSEISVLSFNIDRTESNMDYIDITSSEGITVSNSVSEVFREIDTENDTEALWKWFVIFGLLLLLTEMLILKFFK